jgi:hypothetical protein
MRKRKLLLQWRDLGCRDVLSRSVRPTCTTKGSHTTYHTYLYLLWSPTNPCPDSDRCDTTVVSVSPPRRFCPTLGCLCLVKIVTHRTGVPVVLTSAIVLNVPDMWIRAKKEQFQTFTRDWHLPKGEYRDKLGECLKKTTFRSQDQWRMLQAITHNFPSNNWRHKITKAKDSNRCYSSYLYNVHHRSCYTCHLLHTELGHLTSSKWWFIYINGDQSLHTIWAWSQS